MNNVRFKHFHNENNRLIATIATCDFNAEWIAVGVARCRKGDTPLRKRGKEIAEGRLKKLLSGEMHSSDLEKGEGLFIKRADIAAFVNMNLFSNRGFSSESVARALNSASWNEVGNPATINGFCKE